MRNTLLFSHGGILTVTCDEAFPTDLPNGQMIAPAQPWTLGSILNVSCHHGYEPNLSFITCEPQGSISANWSTLDISCTPSKTETLQWITNWKFITVQPILCVLKYSIVSSIIFYHHARDFDKN